MLEGGGETGVPVTEPFFAMCSETCVSLVWGNDGTLSVSGEGCKRLEIGTNSVPQSNNSRSSRGSEIFFCHASARSLFHKNKYWLGSYEQRYVS